MKDSTTFPRKIKSLAGRLAVTLFWLILWVAAYRIVAKEILLVSPLRAFGRLWELAGTALFWQSVGLTGLRVLAGFCCALLTGAVLAALSARWRAVRALFRPLLGVVRATPVASFIILVLIWIATDRVPVFIAFLMVVPVIYANLYSGILNVDRQLLEMAGVFRLSRRRRLRAIWLPSLMPYFVAACSTGLGFAWKSAVAAEVISQPAFSIGKQIHNAKIYLETADLFAWTIAVVLLSVLLEQAVLRGLCVFERRWGGRMRTAGKGGETHGA